MKKSAFAATAAILAVCCHVIADTVYLKKGDTLENVTITEITATDVKYRVGERAVVYTIPKSDVRRIVYNDGAEDVFEDGTRTERQTGADGETGGSYQESGQGDGGYSSGRAAEEGSAVYMVKRGRGGSGYFSGLVTEEDSVAYMITRWDWRKKSVIQKVRNDELNSDDTVLIARGLKIVHYDTAGVKTFNQLYRRNSRNYRVSAGYSAIGFNAFGTIFPIMQRERMFRNETLRSDRYFMAGFGIGVVEKGLLALSLGGEFTRLELDNLDVLLGYDVRISLSGEEIAGNIEFLYKQWLFSAGISAFLNWNEENRLSFAPSINAAYFIKEIKKSEFPIIENIKRSSDKPRYFRPGIDINYHVYNSEIESFKDIDYEKFVGGLGLFFRIGPDNLYFTTGGYVKIDYMALQETRSLSMFGLSLGTLPLLDVYLRGYLVEIPALLNFGAGQIRFSGGALFDFYVSNEVSVTVLGSSYLSATVENMIYERFEDEFPGGHMYWAVGLDFDILKYWGIGAKLLILGDTYGGKNVSYGFEPSPYQVRISTYFVF